MTEDKYVKTWLFKWIIGGLISFFVLIAGWFAADTKSDLMEIKEAQKSLYQTVGDIDRRTSFLEGLTSSQKQTFKSDVENLLSKIYENK